MGNERKLRLIQVAKEFNVGLNTITDFLHKKGIKSDGSPNTLVDDATYAVLEKEFGSNRSSASARNSVRERISQLLACLEPSQVDGVLEAHVDRNQVLEDLPLIATAPEAASLIILLTRRFEHWRRMLPPAPFVSARSFIERVWPSSLGWSDLGRQGAEPLQMMDVVQSEQERLASLGEEHGERVRGEILGLLGELLGLSPEQQQELASEEGQRRMRESAMRFESQLRKMMESAGEPEIPGDARHMMPGQMPQGIAQHYPFFSQN